MKYSFVANGVEIYYGIKTNILFLRDMNPTWPPPERYNYNILIFNNTSNEAFIIRLVSRPVLL